MQWHLYLFLCCSYNNKTHFPSMRFRFDGVDSKYGNILHVLSQMVRDQRLILYSIGLSPEVIVMRM